MEAHLPLTLDKIPGGGLTEGTKVYIFDESQGDNEVTLVIHHKADEDWDEKKFPGKFQLLKQDPTETDEAVPPTPAAASSATAITTDTIASKEVCFVVIMRIMLHVCYHICMYSRTFPRHIGGDSNC